MKLEKMNKKKTSELLHTVVPSWPSNFVAIIRSCLLEAELKYALAARLVLLCTSRS